jgi:hypothetical protein
MEPCGGDLIVEHLMFTGVDGFLGDKIANVAGDVVRHDVPKVPNALNEKALALRKQRRQAVEKVGRDGIEIPPAYDPRRINGVASVSRLEHVSVLEIVNDTFKNILNKS